jgi:hypothetical protein
VTIDGVAQILLLSPPGVTSVAPGDGALLWEHSWQGGAIVPGPDSGRRRADQFCWRMDLRDRKLIDNP